MFKRAVAFMYDGTKYITTVFDDFVQSSFPEGNVTNVVNTMSNPGIMTALSRPWKVTSPYGVPVLTDAKIERVSNCEFKVEGLLTVDGVVGIYTLEGNDQSWEPVERVDTPEEASEPVEGVLDEPTVPIIEEHVETAIEESVGVTPVEETVVDNSKDTNSSSFLIGRNAETPTPRKLDGNKCYIGYSTVKPISIGKQFDRYKSPNNFCGAEARERRVAGNTPVQGQTPNKSCGDDILGKLTADELSALRAVAKSLKEEESTPVEEPVSRPVPRMQKPVIPEEVVSKATEVEPNYVYVVNEDVNKKIAEEKKEKDDPFKVQSLRGKDIIQNKQGKSNGSNKPYKPVKSAADFDTKAFYESLSSDQRELLEKIPLHCMELNISEFTNASISSEEVRRLGSTYCVTHKWHVQGDWYYIDLPRHMSRYFYNESLDVAAEVPTSTMKRWKLYKESLDG